MRLKEINTEMITDNKCKEILVVMGCEDVSKITIDRDRAILIIGFCQGHQYYELYTYLNGDIKYYRNATLISTPELSKVMHLIQETQWIDPRKELPALSGKVWIKTVDSIILVPYSSGEGFDTDGNCFLYTDKDDYEDMVGWMHEENIEI